MTSPEPFLINRRRRVGWITLVCIVLAAVGFSTQPKESVWPAAAMRVGIVLGALWLCLPARTRPAAWEAITRGRLAVIILTAMLINRVKFVLPLLAIAGFLGWLLRPKKKRW
jgi:chromate transport protein ChrA